MGSALVGQIDVMVAGIIAVANVEAKIRHAAVPCGPEHFNADNSRLFARLPTLPARKLERGIPLAEESRNVPYARGMSFPPDDGFGWLDDLYAVPSTGESDDGSLLFFDPKNARRIFYVHINRPLVHIGTFDPVHIGLLLFR